uniref:SDR family NAD(P)-dependent oxidoreductase n=1 Tax=Paenibacillus xylaniclasticus TaxID=588083 RepID=UPI001FEB5611|nr:MULTISPECIES: SDR family NAD(P)-dependent oxidoreductase [Paenibacillus]
MLPSAHKVPTAAVPVQSFARQTEGLFQSGTASRSDKPSGIALRQLSDCQLQPSKTVVKAGPMITLSSHAAPLSLPKHVKEEEETVSIPSISVGILEEELIASLAQALYIDRGDIEKDKNFVELGMDSIISVEWIRALNKQYGTSIPATKVYDYPTVSDFTTFLAHELNSKSGERTRRKLEPIANPDHAPVQTESSPEPVGGQTIPGTLQSTSAALLLEELTASLAEALYMEKNDIETDKNFVELGLDSIIGVEWIRTLNKQYSTSIPATKVYDYPTIQQFAAFLAQEIDKNGGRFVQRSLTKVQDKVRSAAETLSSSSGAEAAIPCASTRPTAESSGPYSLVEKEVSTSAAPSASKEAIAIVGISGRYPGAKNMQQYWDNLAQAKNSIVEIPKDRWDVDEYYDPRPAQEGKTYCKWLGALEEIEYFDPLFFNISPTEAEGMDPQQRIFLQEAYKAFEDAGYSVSQLGNKKCGVYLGILNNEYSMLLYKNEAQFTNTTGNSNAIAAARISYFLNLKGPAISIDTACSSSLVATHLACQALLNGEIEMALVGGVSLYLTPESYVGMSASGMLSPDGQCNTFDNSANGFVPGEGAGVLVLKRLKDAEEDGDHIYGTIIGSGINQDGKTNGITAPSVNSQIELEREIYSKYNIEPESISYVEMHGTGTKLGDPIELEALSTAFKEKTDRRNYCAIGSVKSNIGHTSAAAGIASVHKVLLCMKQEKLVPTLNFNTPNEHFDFESSPFYVNTNLKDWEPSYGDKRRAAVSSFGFSGTNAHLVLEEYRPRIGTGAKAASASSSVLFVLSAKGEKQLKAYAEEMHSFLAAENNVNLDDLAYTLQVGREPMEYRLAIVADSKEALLQSLKGFVYGDQPAGVWTAQVKKSKDEIIVFEADEDAKSLLETWLKKRRWNKIAEVWVKGLKIDWGKLYGNEKHGRISLPTYPFAKVRCWAPAIEGQAWKGAAPAAAAILHPLLHSNTSDLTEQRYSSTFTGEEFFLKDHVVNGRKVLPGVACLEMARAAVERATGTVEDGKAGICLRNVVWTRPITVEDAPVQLHIGLFLNEKQEISYEIYEMSGHAEAEAIVYSYGSAVRSSIDYVPMLNIEAIQEACRGEMFYSSQLYAIFSDMGIDYGPSHQGIDTVYVGEGQLLAKLILPASVAESSSQFVLHPSMMDSALQATIGFVLGSGEVKPYLPFAIQEVEIFRGCTPVMWSLIRRSADGHALDKVQKLDIDLCDETGAVCVRIKGYSSRKLNDESISSRAAFESSLLMAAPVWQEKDIPIEAETPVNECQVAILCQPSGISREQVESQMNGTRCIIVPSVREGIGEQFQHCAVQVLEELQRMLEDHSHGRSLIQIAYCGQEQGQLLSGLSGLLRSSRLEHPKLAGQLIELEHEEDWTNIVDRLKENSRCPEDIRIRYRNNKRLVFGWNEVQTPPEAANIPWKDSGVYLITGGAGGLGLIFAKEILSKVHHATIILTGRSMLDDRKRAALKELEAAGARRVVYRQADVSSKQVVVDLIRDIQTEFGGINGILHSAGVIRDSLIRKKNRTEMLEVLAPKVLGTVNLDYASRYLPLDFFVLFSSVAGGMGNRGQADYAAANAFMDSYAEYRSSLVAGKQRHGQTLSINWPLWKEGGMRIDEQSEELARQHTGMIGMLTATGIQAFYLSMAAGINQVMVMEGSLEKMKRTVGLLPASGIRQPDKAAVVSTAASISHDVPSLLDKVQAAIVQAVSKMLKVKIEDIDAYVELGEYGFDSILLTQFANNLNRLYPLDLTPDVFFEYSTIRNLSVYLVKEYEAVFAAHFAVNKPAGGDRPAFDEAPAVKDDAAEIARSRRTRSRFMVETGESAQQQSSAVPEPIAIVGMSGAFPMARNVDEYWNNLVEGKDCITEIPEDRWDWKAYYGDPANEANKTNIKWGGFMDGVYEFDPLFFGISPREAVLMDPQQRLLMTYIWKAIEDAGISAGSLSGTRTGIFAATANSGYSNMIYQGDVSVEAYSSSGMAPSVGPNRMSYFLNIHGPSEPVETACSSSLVAIHRAIKAIEDGSCDMAIAGGVNVIVSPELHISFNKAGMLSEDGRCKTFSDQANGYVRGEGVGMLFLKKLKDAEQAGDHIYGIIRGTAVNHGGRANSLTAPNPRAQADLLIDAYTKAGIDPRTVSYIEAHGTGTELGDPIEINGLKTAFKELYSRTEGPGIKEPYCGLGSVKTNIGHLELAAGIAGVIKVLLQLKHKTLVKSLHCDTINSYIKLEGSPFYIVQEAREWETLTDAQGEPVPRIAGISSFGFGGVNAHLIIEEYNPPKRKTEPVVFTEQKPAIVVLSSKSEWQLKEQARQLLAAIEKRSFIEESLGDIAYTLQVGREAMEERLAILAGSLHELEQRLKAFVEGRVDNSRVFLGHVKRLGARDEDKDAAGAIEALVGAGDYTQIAELWVQGTAWDWSKLYGDTKPNRVSLPTYPFARELYCISDRNNRMTLGGTVSKRQEAMVIHPLLHRNTSDVHGLRFSSTFTGEEFFLADHVIGGRRLLPGVAHLEMARAAGEQIADFSEHSRGQMSVQLKDVAWVRPAESGERPISVHIGLYPLDGGEIAYEIFGDSGESGTDRPVYSEGRLAFAPITEAPVLNITAVREQCRVGTLSSYQCYEAFGDMGIFYGPMHQGIEKVYAGVDQALAKLSLPSSGYDTTDQFVMHPGLMDAAFQSVIGLNAAVLSSGKAAMRPALPFALEELVLFNQCSSEMWAWVRYSERSRQESTVLKVDIDLCDEQGTVCVRMKGLTLWIDDREAARLDKRSLSETLMLEPIWEELPSLPGGTAPDYRHHLVVLCEPEVISGEMIEARMEGVRCLVLQSEPNDIDKRFMKYAAQVFDEVQRLLKSQPKGKVLVQLVVPTKGERQLLTGLFGLLKTAWLENPMLVGQLIELDDEEEHGVDITDRLQETGLTAVNVHIRYASGRRYASAMVELNSFREAFRLPWKEKGVYLLTGGTGSLGLICAGEMARHAEGAVMILVGRSPLRSDVKARMEEIQSLGARVIYRQADVADREAVEALIRDIRESFGRLDGIIHGAGVIHDNFIINKTVEELHQVLAPKVAGLVNLDEACKDMPLDFFILFSSVAGRLGNIGQADYAAANAFMDAFATYRDMLVERKQRHGRTLSINWPLWKEGGMRIDKETEQIMEGMGMVAMETGTGIRALYDGLLSGKSQMMVLEGDAGQLRETLLQPTLNQSADTSSMVNDNSQDAGTGQELLIEKTANYLKQLLASSIGLSARQIEIDAPMEKYGIDSIMIKQLTRELEKTFGLLPKTLFFEYQNIRALAQYFVEAHRDRLAKQLGIKEEAAAESAYMHNLAQSDRKWPPSGSQRQSPYSPKQLQSKQEPKTMNRSQDIAIIGLSGMFPEADNVRSFWNNLRNGKDCVKEIPEDRWDHSLYYDEDKMKPGKTYSKWGGFINGVDEFDPRFFNISPREAEIIDPQERLFLKCVYETIEDAGYTRDTLEPERNVGVFVGVMYEEYQLYGAQEQARGRMLAIPGNPASIANRVSYYCNFHGPSMAVDTMCSSSLTTVHLACQSLQLGECELAIAGGVNVSIHPNKYLMLGQGQFVSSKGRCESFGEGGDGYVPGEGVGAVLLKPLEKAIADGDHIYGVIKGIAVNHGGKTNGYSVPNPNAQASVIRKALKKSGINPRVISYIEAHGTGTSLGDPIEIAGLQKVFREFTEDKQFCAIGSVKSNIGHCESAAGIAGLIKVLLQLKYRQLVPSLHSSTLNPNIDFNDSPFLVQQELTEWKRPVVNIDGKMIECPRIAGISSFGAGGSNAHVLIEEYIPEEQEMRDAVELPRYPGMVILSAKNKERLNEQVQRLLAALKEPEYAKTDLYDIAFTLQVGREPMEERLAVVVNSVKELEEKLESFLAGDEETDGLYLGQAKKNKDILAVLETDEDMASMVDSWIGKGKFTKLAELWVKGLDIDWNRLYGNTRPRRISLPTYPFAKERYWVNITGNQSRDVEPEPAAVESPVQEQLMQDPDLTIKSITHQQPLVKVLDKPQGIVLRSLSDRQSEAGEPARMDGQTTALSAAEFTATQPKAQPSMQPEAKPPYSIQLEEKRTPVQQEAQLLQAQPAAELSARQLAAGDDVDRKANGQRAIRAESLHKELIETLAKALNMNEEDIGYDEKFVDMGVDSIIGVEWVQSINKRYGTSISATKVYDYPSIKEFSRMLAKELNKQAPDGQQASVEPSSRQPMQALIEQVLEGALDIEQADRLLKQMHS